MARILRGMMVIWCLSLCACATHRPEIKAPCDPLACTERTNVNTWSKGE